MFVSVIILNWNRKYELSLLLNNLKNQTFKKFETIVVDNGSVDDSVVYLKKNFPHVSVINTRKNIGIAAKNYGFRKALGDYFIVLDSDVKIEKDCIERFVEKLANNKDLGMACASVYDFGSKKYLGPNRSIKGNTKRGYEVCFFNGTAIAIKKEVWKKVGGYDKDYFICLEELEWAARILEAGFDIRCFTDIKVYNRKSTKGGEYRAKQGYWYCRNWILFYAKFLPVGEIPIFLKIHTMSFFKKSNRSENKGFNKLDCILGGLVGLALSPKYLITRTPVCESTLQRIKLDLFPNKKHLYAK